MTLHKRKVKKVFFFPSSADFATHAVSDKKQNFYCVVCFVDRRACDVIVNNDWFFFIFEKCALYESWLWKCD